uniref:CD276 antigen n=1 Tax=Maylandia zebra TaxID=106582 RepID=UPI000D31754F|nr:CD276 antigen-like [Maylandia zebra]
MKMASYFRRTELFMDDMKHGNISLKILNVSEEDNGRYRCFIPKLQSRVKAAVVELVVDQNFAKTSTTETPLQTPDPQDTTPTNGEVVVIGSNLPIIAAPGDDVILPCHLEPTFDVQGLTVEWSKPNLKPDPSDEYVHLYRHGKEVPDMKMASYFRRTELFMDDMKHGNISLKILNVSEEDNGRYRCFIPKLQSRVKAAVVELVVDQNFAKTSTTETPLQTPDPQDTTPTNGEKTSDSCSHTRGEALMKRASAFGNQQLDTESEGEILEAAEEKT